MEPILRVEHLTHTYGSGTPFERSAVQDLTPAGLQALVCGDDVTKHLLSALPGKAVCTAQAGDPAFAVIPSLTLTNFSAPFARRYEIRFQVVLG